ncbi:hypothetical protein D9M68_650820 [compost metagenome]
MRLVDNEDEFIPGISFEPIPSLLEDAALDGAHEHVFKHGVVGDEQFRATLLHLVPGHELTVTGLRNKPMAPVVGNVLLASLLT